MVYFTEASFRNALYHATNKKNNINSKKAIENQHLCGKTPSNTAEQKICPGRFPLVSAKGAGDTYVEGEWTRPWRWGNGID